MNGCEDVTTCCGSPSPTISARRMSRFSTRRWYASLGGVVVHITETDGIRASSLAMSYATIEGAEEGFAERRQRRIEPPRSEESSKSSFDVHAIPKMEALSIVN